MFAVAFISQVTDECVLSNDNLVTLVTASWSAGGVQQETTLTLKQAAKQAVRYIGRYTRSSAGR